MDNQYTAPNRNGGVAKDSQNSDTEACATAVRNKVNDVVEKVSGQASEMGQQLTAKMDQARHKTHDALETTSKSLAQAADYIDRKTYADMVEDVRGIVRQHPGKSILLGVGIGLLLARAFRR